MRRTLLRRPGAPMVLALALGFVLAVGLGFAQVRTAAAAKPQSKVKSSRAELQKRLDKLVKLGAPGAIALVRDRRGTWIGVAGVADKKTGRKVVRTDSWRMASVTKIVTAAIVQKLAREGKLKLDDKISRYLPKIVPLANRITIRQLLNHTSGIPDYFAGENAVWLDSARDVAEHLRPNKTVVALIGDANKLPRVAKPGARHEYSNTNYLVLQLLIEKLTGAPFELVVQKRVIEPLKLKSTGFPDKLGQVPVRHLHGYIPLDTAKGPFTDKKRLLDVTNHRIFGEADGSLYSNAQNLATILDALWAGRLIKRADFAAMLDRLVSDHDGTYRYGLGIMALPQSCGRTLYGHEGRDLGTFTLAFADRNNQRQVILVVNRAVDETPKIEEAAFELLDRVACRK